MMSDTYQRLQEQSDLEWKFGRAKLIRNMERETSTPIPINLFSKLIHIVKMLYKTKCRCRKTGVASEPGDENGSVPGSHERRKSTTGVDAFGEAFEQEWDLIYAVVDWGNIVDKYLDSKGEGQSTKPKKRGKGLNNRERRRTKMLAEAAKAQGASGNARAVLHDAADATIVKMSVVNSLKI